MHLRPDGTIAIDGKARLLGRVEAHHVEVAPRRALGALGHVHAVPDGRMRLLQRRELHRHVVEGKVLALEVEHFLREPLEHEIDSFRVDLLRDVGIGAVILDLDRDRAATEADLQPAAAELVDHADFLDQPQRMMQRHRPYQRTETQPLGALRDRRQEDARRGREAQRRRMMLGEMIGVESGAVVSLHHLEAVFVIIREGAAVAVEMVEDAEFHVSPAIDRLLPFDLHHLAI